MSKEREREDTIANYIKSLLDNIKRQAFQNQQDAQREKEKQEMERENREREEREREEREKKERERKGLSREVER